MESDANGNINNQMYFDGDCSMSNIKLVHSGGNSVSLTTPDSNPAANRTFKLPGADGTSGQALVTDT